MSWTSVLLPGVLVTQLHFFPSPPVIGRSLRNTEEGRLISAKNLYRSSSLSRSPSYSEQKQALSILDDRTIVILMINEHSTTNQIKFFIHLKV